MKKYLVGGSVRDELLGLPVQDRDYVVVGADPAQMLRRLQAVGADFPVFSSQTHYVRLALPSGKTARATRASLSHPAPDVTLGTTCACSTSFNAWRGATTASSHPRCALPT